MSFCLHLGDCLATLRTMPANSVDSIVTDPPYGLSFMGKRWDYDVPSVDVWAECLRVLKPGGHLLAFAGTRTQHRMAVRIEDAGFEIRDMIAWVYGNGFPKSLDVSKALDKIDATEARRERQLRFTGWMRSTGLTSSQIDAITDTNMGGHYTTAASQPAVATREHFEKLRPFIDAGVPDWVEQMVDERTVESENFKRRELVGLAEMRDTRAIRVAVTASAAGYDAAALRDVEITQAHTAAARQWQGWGTALKPALEPITVARKPLSGTVAQNVLQHGTGAMNIDASRIDGERWPANLIHDGCPDVVASFPNEADGASASRFFYCAKASAEDRGATNTHPTVKPTDLMRYLCRLVTPPGGLVLDPFTGSGSTGKAAVLEGFDFVGCELSAEYLAIAEARITAAAFLLQPISDPEQVAQGEQVALF